MFETAALRPAALRKRLLRIETLPVSIAIHAVAIGAAYILYNTEVTFPKQTPRLVTAYALFELPVPPPPPPPPAAPRAVAPVVKLPDIQLAPTVIPDTIPDVPKDAQQVVTDVASIPENLDAGVAGGEAGGVVGGTPGGIVGGKVDGAPPPPPPPPPPPADGRVHIERDKPLPMFPLSQTYPQYPEEQRVKRQEDSLVVRYIIGKDGRVKMVEILNHAQFKPFDDAALRAIRFWRFKPMMKDGQPVEVVHELTVNFQLDAK